MSGNTNKDELLKRIANLEKENANLKTRLNHIKDIYDNTTIGIYRTNIDGKILNVNPPLIKMMGFDSFEDLKEYDLNSNKLILNEDRQSFIDEISEKGIIIGRNAIWIKKNGEKIHIRESAKAIKDKNGNIKFFEGTVEDISIQVQKEKRLTEVEDWYKRLVETMPNGVVIHKDGTAIYANEYAKNALFSNNSIKKNDSTNVYDFIHPDYHKKVKERLLKSEKEFKEANTTEQVFLTSEGNPLHAEVVTIPYKHEGEIYLLTVFTDITDRKITEKELKLSEVTYRGMLNSISEAIFIQDYDGNFIDVNRTAEDLFGYPNEYFQGKNPTHLEAKGKNDYNSMLTQIRSAFNGKREILKFWCKKSDGTEFPAEVTLVAGTYFDKRVVIAVLRDITERKAADAAIKESEQKYRQLINFAVSGILIGSIDGKIIDANTYMCKLLGLKKSEVVGKNISEGIFTKESLKNKPLNFEQLQKGRTVVSQREIKRPDGTIIPIEMYTKMMPDGTYQSIYHDISERKKAEKQILEAKAKAESLNIHKDALLSTLPDILFTFDSKGTIIDYYSNSNDQLLLPPSRFLNKDISTIMPKKIASLTKEQIKSVLKSKKLSNFQYKLTHQNSTEYFDAKMVYFREDQVLTVIRNISERMNLIKDLQNAMQKAEESDKLKSAFLSNLSHEIRTPMNGILGFTELLKDDISKEEKLDYLNIIENSCNQLLLILDDIIEISKIEAGIIKKRIDTVEINSLLKEIHQQLNALFPKSRNVQFVLSKPNSKEIKGTTDKIKLKQILSNFISNASKFTQKGKVELGYSIVSDSHIEFYVKDSGVGISKENLDKIFNRFVQIDNQISSLSRGSGLGLSICQAYAEILDGEIRVESELENGSTFYLKIPIFSFS